MCNGTIMDKLISFSVPLMVSGILQLLFNAVDIICGRKVQWKLGIGGGWFYNGADQCIYKSVYRRVAGSQCTCGQILCCRKRPGDVWDSTYSDHICPDQRCCNGFRRINLFQICTGDHGNAGWCHWAGSIIYEDIFYGDAIFYVVQLWCGDTESGRRYKASIDVSYYIRSDQCNTESDPGYCISSGCGGSGDCYSHFPDDILYFNPALSVQDGEQLSA